MFSPLVHRYVNTQCLGYRFEVGSGAENPPTCLVCLLILETRSQAPPWDFWDSQPPQNLKIDYSTIVGSTEIAPTLISRLQKGAFTADAQCPAYCHVPLGSKAWVAIPFVIDFLTECNGSRQHSTWLSQQPIAGNETSVDRKAQVSYHIELGEETWACHPGILVTYGPSVPDLGHGRNVHGFGLCFRDTSTPRSSGHLTNGSDGPYIRDCGWSYMLPSYSCRLSLCAMQHEPWPLCSLC